MASRVTRVGQLVVANENLHIHHKKPIVNENTKILGTAAKRGGAGLGGRKALNDITNKVSRSHDVSSKKKSVQKEEFNVAEERFLHDHEKCVAAQRTALDTFLLDLVLPERDILSEDRNSEFNIAKDDLFDSPLCPEPEELPMSDFSDWLEPSWESPPSSPYHLDSQPSSPFGWHFEDIEFKLRQEDDDDDFCA